MKRIGHDISRVGDRVTIKALWRDRFKRPATVNISKTTEEIQVERTLIDGDVKDVTETMFGIAEIAWGMGWRPAGLGPTLAAVVERFQLPKPE